MNRFITLLAALACFWLFSGCGAWRTESAEANFAQGRHFDAIGYPKEAAVWYRRAANRGYCQAQVEVGFLYRYGKTRFLQDPYEAERWFGSVSAGRAHFALADFGEDIYQYGSGGVLIDENTADDWFAKAVTSCGKAAEQGDLEAQTLLAALIGTGTGTARNSERAIELWHDAAERDHAPAQYWLARSYSHRNLHEPAFAWMRRAAEQGSGAAQYRLSLMLQLGQGTAVQHDQALIWLQRAAEQGYLFAQRQARSITMLNHL